MKKGQMNQGNLVSWCVLVDVMFLMDWILAVTGGGGWGGTEDREGEAFLGVGGSRPYLV